MMRSPMRKVIAAVAFGLGCLLARGAAAQAPGVRVLASNGVKAVVEALQKEGERATGHPLSITFNSSAALKQSMDTGAAFDVVIVTKDMMGDLVKEGRVVP